MNMKLVSVIIPAYNASKFIGETIQSVIDQTHKNWELIIVDDGSTDSTAEKINAFSSDPRIKSVRQNNAGVSTARNHGLELAKGDFIAFLDADDVWLPNNLESKLLVLNSEEIDFVFGDIYYTDENLQNKIPGDKGTDVNIVENILLWEGEVIPCPSGNLLIKRRCFDKGLKFDPNFSTAADQDFSLYLSRDFKGKYIHEHMMLYRFVNASMSKNIPVMESDHINVYRKAKEKKLFKSFWFKQRCFSNLYLILAGSYWKNAGKKWKGFIFILKSVFTYPPNILKVFKKI